MRFPHLISGKLLKNRSLPKILPEMGFLMSDQINEYEGHRFLFYNSIDMQSRDYFKKIQI